MFKRILVAYDGSASATAALDMMIDLAQRLDTDLTSISVEEHLPRYAASISEVEGAKEEIDAHFRTLTKNARDAAALAGVELETVVRQGNQVDEILRFAREGQFDLLALGSHGHGRVFQRLIGSTSLSVARVTPCSVLIARGAPSSPPGLGHVSRILVGLDGSPLGRLAFRTALDLAVVCGADVIAVTVREASPLGRADVGYIEILRRAAEEYARSAGTVFEHVTLSGHAAHALATHAREANVQLLVIGATGLEHPWSLALGGTATGLVSEARCSVLLVRPPQAILHVREVMATVVTSVPVDAPLVDVIELLLRRNVKAVPVLDGRKHVAGIITGGDLLERGDLGLRLSLKQELDTETLGERLRALSQSRKRAGDVMTRHVHMIDADADLPTAIRLMAVHDVKRLPVVDQDKTLIGIVSRADVLRAIAALPQPGAHAEHGLPSVSRRVADAITTDVPVVRADTPAEEVIERVLESDLRRVIVTEAADRVVGLVSDRDLLLRSGPDTRPWLARLLRGARPASSGTTATPSHAPLKAADLMATSLITIRPEEPLAHAIRLMMQHRIKRLIVVDDEHRFRGLVDRRAVLRALAGE